MPEDPQASNILTSFAKLSKNAASLNSATDSMNAAVRKLESALAKLNLGITSWFAFNKWGESPEDGEDYLGYTKWGDKWCICIRQVSFDYNHNCPGDEEQVWPFTDAPRYMRIQAIPFLHKMIEKLNEDADKAWRTIAEKAVEAEEFAEQITLIADNEASGHPRPKKVGAR